RCRWRRPSSPVAPDRPWPAATTEQEGLERRMKDPKESVHDRQVRPFADFLREQRSSQLHTELSDSMNELVARVYEVGKAGELPLTISVKPAAKNSEAVIVGDD